MKDLKLLRQIESSFYRLQKLLVLKEDKKTGEVVVLYNSDGNVAAFFLLCSYNMLLLLEEREKQSVCSAEWHGICI